MNKPFVSILILVRHSEYFSKSINSLLRTCSHKDVEVLVKVDTDEDVSPYLQVLQKSGLSHTILRSDRRGGGSDLHLFFQDLYKISQGEFIFFWSDDLLMHDKGWVEKLREAQLLFEDKIMVCTFSRGYKQKGQRSQKRGSMCPVASRQFLECNDEYISPGRGVDKYLKLIASAVKRYVFIPGISFSVNELPNH